MRNIFCHTTLQGAVLGVTIALCGLAARGETSTSVPRFTDEAIQKVYPALVRIYVVMEHPRSGRIERVQGAGSGAIISEDGYLVTNHHVARRGTRYVCNLANQDEVDAELVGTDPLSDIAVLKLNLDQRKDPTAPVPVAQWGDSDAVQVGDVVFAMGSPAAVSQSITQGIVSNTQLIMPKMAAGMFKLDGENVGALVRWLAHDAVIFGGNSGGPLVNAEGQIIGINEIGLGSLGGAIPGNLARKMAEELIAKGHIDRSWTGLLVQPRLKSGPEIEGVLVGGVVDPSPAKEAGLQAGDVLTHFNGTAVDCEIPEHLPLFNRVVYDTPIGSTVEVKYIRDGEPLQCALTTMDREHAMPFSKEFKPWGITAHNLTRMKALHLKRDTTDGVFIESLRPGGGAAEAKPALQPNDVLVSVNGEAVKNVEELKALTLKLEPEEGKRTPVLVEVERKQQKILTVVKLGREPDEEKPARTKKPWPAARTQVLTTDLAKALGLEKRQGVRITQLVPGHAAEKAGLQVGDIIIKVDGMPVEASQPEHREVYATMLRNYRVGTEAELDVLRDGEALKLTMPLEAPPDQKDRMPSFEDDDFEFTARELSLEDRLDSDKPEPGNVVISDMENGGWAHLGGLRKNDVILRVAGQEVTGIDSLKSILRETKEGQPRRVTFLVRRDIYTSFKEVEPTWD